MNAVANTETAREDPRVRGARTKLERTRAALLAAAADNFARKGWHGARMEDIAEAGGVSPATAYNHFSTKHSLIGHLLAPLIRPSVERALQQLENEDPAILEVLKSHVRELAELMRQNQDLTVPFVSAVQDYTIKVEGPPDPADPNDPRNLVPLPDAVIRAVDMGQARGLFRPYPPARDVGANLTNLLLLRTFTRPKERAEESTEFVLTLLLGALLPQLLIDAGQTGRPFRRPSKSI